MRNRIFFLLSSIGMISFSYSTCHATTLPVNDASMLNSLNKFSIPIPSPDDSAKSNFRKEKLIASILAFPVPFGFTGLHRIYLGTEPWVPVCYLITGGGGCLILPIIDFIFIVSADEEEFKSYCNNPKFFMWIE